jgi:predicted aconitase with swiveling domain
MVNADGSVAVAAPLVTDTVRAPVAASGSTKNVAVSAVGLTYVVCTVTPEPLTPTVVALEKPDPVTVVVAVVPMRPLVTLKADRMSAADDGAKVALATVAPVADAEIVADDSAAPV